jgi:hypothetical protein
METGLYLRLRCSFGVRKEQIGVGFRERLRGLRKRVSGWF